jgi:hypothetical protein
MQAPSKQAEMLGTDGYAGGVQDSPSFIAELIPIYAHHCLLQQRVHHSHRLRPIIEEYHHFWVCYLGII